MHPEIYLPQLMILLLCGVLSIGGLIILGKWISRAQRPEVAPPAETGRLEEMVDSLRDEVQRLSGHVDALDERMDFTERLLSAPRDRDPPSG
jgi:hypothetical protein